MSIVRYTLNDTTFTFCRETGALLCLEYPGVRPMMKNKALGTGDRATYGGLIDIAWPVHYEYETLRANPTGKANSKPPRMEYDGKSLTITYDELPRTYDDPDIQEAVAGGIHVKIELKAMEDGKSVSLRCLLKNNSKTAIRQILFPSFEDLARTDSSDVKGGTTEFTMMGGRINPYTSQRFKGQRECTLRASGIESGPYMGRWYNWGSYEGGFSVYHRHWGWDKDNPELMGDSDPLYLRYDAGTDRIRVSGFTSKRVEEGETWDSEEFILTAHAGNWYFGAGPYKEWLHKNVKRVVPMPRRAREMMGFRTIYMANYPNDPEDVSYYYRDMPEIAEDMAQHGIFDMNVWKGFNWNLPISEDCFYKRWGGLPAWKDAVKKCREYGVTVTAFVSYLSLWGPNCDTYGIKERSGTWAASSQLIPESRAPYAEKWGCWQLWDQYNHPRWKNDVLEALRFIRDQADCPDISWDQYVLGHHSDDTLHDLINEYRLETEKLYPGSVWSSESTLFFESELDNADFTWNGTGFSDYRGFDFRPLMSIVNLMRPDIGLSGNTQDIKTAFMDNLMMNITGGGKCFFKNNPETAETMKILYALRQHYLGYMAYGENLADGVLCAPAVNCRATAYKNAEGRILLYALKNGGEPGEIALDLTSFMDGERHSVRVLNERMELQRELEIGAKTRLEVLCADDELEIFEIS